MLIYWALLTYVLLKPGKDDVSEYWFYFSGIDKVVHLGFFIVLGFLFRWSFPKLRTVFLFVILFVYSLLTEVLQEVMKLGRTGDVYDLLFDVIGFTLGYLLCKVVRKLWNINS